MTLAKPIVFTWTSARRKGAKLAASTTMTQEEIAKECSVHRMTVNTWFQCPEFLEKINEYILLDERATKAGLLKRALISLEKKSKKSADDKTTELDLMKFISELVGLTDQKGDVNIINAVGISNTPEVKDAANTLCKRIRETLDATISE